MTSPVQPPQPDPKVAQRGNQTGLNPIPDSPRRCRCGHHADWHVWDNTACGDCGCPEYREIWP